MNNLTIEKSKMALVVIDLQKGIVARPLAPHAAETVVKNASELAKAFRNSNMPVFLVHVTPSPDRKDALHPLADVALSPPNSSPGWSDIVPEMGPESGDFVIIKRQWGAFTGTELDLQLRRRGITTIVLCGVSTDIGVESTARFAYELGYNQIFVEDAMSAMSADEHAHTITKIFPRIGQVRSTEEIIASL